MVAHTTDDEAAVLERWEPLVNRMLARYGRGLPRPDRADLRQELRAAVLVAHRRYDARVSAHTGRPVAFMTYVYTGCQRAAWNHLRAHRRAGRVAAESVLSAEPTVVGDAPDREHPGEPAAWPWELWRRVACAGRLDDREGRVVYWRMHGLRLAEIGFREGLTKERVRQIHDLAMDKLRVHSAAVAAVTDDLPRRGVVR